MNKRTAAVLFSLAITAIARPVLAETGETPAPKSFTGTVQAEPGHSVEVESLAKFAEEMIQAAKVQHVGFEKTPSGDGVEIVLTRKFIKKLPSSHFREVDLGRRVSFEVVDLPLGTIEIRNIKGICLRAKHHIKVTELTFTINNDGLHVANMSGKRLGITRTATAKLSGRLYSFVATMASQVKTKTQEAQHALANSAKAVSKTATEITGVERIPTAKSSASNPATTADASAATAAKESSSDKAAAQIERPRTLGDALETEESLNSASKPAPGLDKLVPLP